MKTITTEATTIDGYQRYDHLRSAIIEEIQNYNTAAPRAFEKALTVICAECGLREIAIVAEWLTELATAANTENDMRLADDMLKAVRKM